MTLVELLLRLALGVDVDNRRPCCPSVDEISLLVRLLVTLSLLSLLILRKESDINY